MFYLIRSAFSRKWLLTSLLVFLGTGLCIRLGIWQLDRLDQRRVFNAQVETMRSLPTLDLNAGQPDDLIAQEWRAVGVTGTYDFENQVGLRNQYYGNQYGYHLLTPLLFADGKAVLVDRGWIPADGNSTPGDWRNYDEVGAVTLSGQIRLGQTKPVFGGEADPTLSPRETRLDLWINADITRISRQLPYKILPVYIQPNADSNDVTPPVPFQPEVDLTEGPHFGYALQWFTFAAILFFGYPFFLQKQEAEEK
jgi:surfeit locus 1 family protein